MKTFIAALALATVLASPAFAQSSELLAAPAQSARTSPYSAYNAVTPFGSPAAGITNAAREAAIRHCNAAAAGFKENTWGSMQVQQYRSCMAQHGQAE